MKSKLLFGFLIILAAAIFFGPACVIWSTLSMYNTRVTSQPDQVVRDFYTWYLDDNGNPLVDRTYQSNRHLSPKMIVFLDEYTREGMSYDPMFCGDTQPTEIRAAPAKISGGQATVAVITSIANHGFSVELIYQNGDWLIDKVNCTP